MRIVLGLWGEIGALLAALVVAGAGREENEASLALRFLADDDEAFHAPSIQWLGNFG